MAIDRPADGDAHATAGALEEIQHWTGVIGSAQQMMLEHLADQLAAAKPAGDEPAADPVTAMARAGAEFWRDSLGLWESFLLPANDREGSAVAARADKDRRFSAPQWRDNPLFDLIRQSYLMISDHLLQRIEAVEGIEPRQREQMKFLARTWIDAMSPSNFALTNPQVIERTIETKGANLLKGLEHMLRDLSQGQLTHTDASAFEVGRNIAVTPGKVVRRTPLYELIQYTPTTAEVFETPLVIFPPWINRFYILDLNPEKSFIRWAVEQGLTVFVVSWKSADASLSHVTIDDYVLGGIVDAVDAVRDLLDVPAVHTIGYCVAGTNLAAALALLAARGEEGKVASATFFTAQVDFASAGDLNLFIDDEQLNLISALSADSGYLDGRYMAATFNLLRGRDLIWNYVVNNYLLGNDYPPFDLLFWNSDTTNLPARWHQSYLKDLYRDNKLVHPGAITIDGTPIDLTRVKTPAYIQAGREDHIAPPESVWKMTRHFSGPSRFVLAGSGHIAGVINPPAANKYQYWTNSKKAGSLKNFLAGASEHKGSWWPDWIEWIAARSGSKRVADGARVPGGGKFPALADAPGDYVKSR